MQKKPLKRNPQGIFDDADTPFLQIPNLPYAFRLRFLMLLLRHVEASYIHTVWGNVTLM